MEEAPQNLLRQRGALLEDLDAPAALALLDTWAATAGDDDDAPALVRATADALLGVFVACVVADDPFAARRSRSVGVNPNVTAATGSVVDFSPEVGWVLT